jgi:rare lipoprotein A
MSVSCAQSAPSNSNTKVQTGKASYYSTSCNGGTKTASGKKLNNNANTVAHKTLPMGTKVKVTNLRNGKSEICQVSDRGPYVRGRIVDVTIGVARKLDFVKAWVVDVKIEVLN